MRMLKLAHRIIHDSQEKIFYTGLVLSRINCIGLPEVLSGASSKATS